MAAVTVEDLEQQEQTTRSRISKAGKKLAEAVLGGKPLDPLLELESKELRKLRAIDAAREELAHREEEERRTIRRRARDAHRTEAEEIATRRIDLAKEIDTALAELEGQFTAFIDLSTKLDAACKGAALPGPNAVAGGGFDATTRRIKQMLQAAFSKNAPTVRLKSEMPRISAARWQDFEESARQTTPTIPAEPEPQTEDENDG